MLHAFFAATSDHTDVYVATTGEVIAAIVTTAGVVAVAMLAAGIPIRRKAKKERDESRQVTKAIHDQVGNDHDTNLRDDIDGIRNEVGEVLAVMKKLVSRQDRTSGDIGKVKADIATVVKTTAELNERLDNHIDGR